MAVTHTQRVFLHSRSTLAARLVLLVIADCAPDGGDSTRLSVAEIGRRAALSRRQTITATRTLERLGELVIIPGHGPGPAAFNQQVITLTDNPLPPPPPSTADIVQARRRSLRSRGMQRVVWDQNNWTCQARRDADCTPHAFLTIGHKIPIEDGGTDDLDNLQTECTHCNTAKGAR
jgi:HNH endonuclease